MIIRKLVISLILLSSCGSLLAQANDIYRVQALKFFCQNKYDILRINDWGLGSIEPLFVLNLEMSSNDSSEFLYIDSSSFASDTAFIDNFLHTLRIDTILDNRDTIDVSYPLDLSEFCGCVYQSLYDEKCAETMVDITCSREYGIMFSPVVPYKGLKYVMLRIDSYFMAKVNGFQLCLMEFTNEANLKKCFVGGLWWVD